MPFLIALIAGSLFGLGLAVSGMMNPAKVLSFLDVTGNWDPSLMLVMGGAVALTVPGFWLILKRPAPFLDRKFYMPDATVIDKPLLAGAALFGLGWGMVGLCPGPAIAGLSTGEPRLALFVVAMLAGYQLMSFIERRSATQ
jgi:hypothetical protein